MRASRHSSPTLRVQHHIRKLPSAVLLMLALLVVTMTLASCGEAAPERSPIRVQALNVEGERITYADLASTDTVLWFWAPW